LTIKLRFLVRSTYELIEHLRSHPATNMDETTNGIRDAKKRAADLAK